MPKFVDHELIVSMRRLGRTVPEIAKAVGCCERSVCGVLATNGLRIGQRKFTCDRARLLELWERGLTYVQIGIKLGCSAATVTELVREMQMPPRNPLRHMPEIGVSPEEDAASADSLALSPWVQSRIRELRIGMPA